MKYFFLLTIGLFLLISCGEEVEDNTPAFQAVKGNTFFKSFSNFAAINSDGSLIVRGARDEQEVIITVASLNQTNVILGKGAAQGNFATYTDEFGNVFSTNNGNGSGAVNLQLNNDETVSGTFNFMALTEDEAETIAFSRGVVFEVSFLEPLGEEAQNLNSFTARVNTIAFVPSEINTSLSDEVLEIRGVNGEDIMSLTMPSDIAPGIYQIAIDGMFTALFLSPEGVANATAGTLTIVSNNTTEQRIVGDFLFDTPNGFLVTDGEFDVSY